MRPRYTECWLDEGADLDPALVASTNHDGSAGVGASTAAPPVANVDHANMIRVRGCDRMPVEHTRFEVVHAATIATPSPCEKEGNAT